MSKSCTYFITSSFLKNSENVDYFHDVVQPKAARSEVGTGFRSGHSSPELEACSKRRIGSPKKT